MLSAMQLSDHPSLHRKILSNAMYLQVSRYGRYCWRENFPRPFPAPNRQRHIIAILFNTIVATSHALLRNMFLGSFMPRNCPCNAGIDFWAFRKADGYRVTAPSPLFIVHALKLEEGFLESLKPA